MAETNNPVHGRNRGYSKIPAFQHIWKFKSFYIIILPALIYFIVFSYIPYYGLTIAFKDFKIFGGIAASPWVGFKHFNEIFTSPDFFKLIRNTVMISLYRIVFEFPVPIILALLLNEVRHSWYKRTIQTITYFPNFLSWVVYGGIMMSFVQPSGMINEVLKRIGAEPLQILTTPSSFIAMLIITSIIKSSGFGAIIYLASLSGIDIQQYESAIVDGANKIRQIWHITLPGIRPTIVIMFILAIGNIMNAGFEQIFIMYNAAVYEVADIVDTFVYRIGLQGAQYSISTAVGIFKGIIGFVLIYFSNSALRRLGEASIW